MARINEVSHILKKGEDSISYITRIKKKTEEHLKEIVKIATRFDKRGLIWTDDFDIPYGIEEDKLGELVYPHVMQVVIAALHDAHAKIVLKFWEMEEGLYMLHEGNMPNDVRRERMAYRVREARQKWQRSIRRILCLPATHFPTLRNQRPVVTEQLHRLERGHTPIRELDLDAGCTVEQMIPFYGPPDFLKGKGPIEQKFLVDEAHKRWQEFCQGFYEGWVAMNDRAKGRLSFQMRKNKIQEARDKWFHLMTEWGKETLDIQRPLMPPCQRTPSPDPESREQIKKLREEERQQKKARRASGPPKEGRPYVYTGERTFRPLNIEAGGSSRKTQTGTGSTSTEREAHIEPPLTRNDVVNQMPRKVITSRLSNLTEEEKKKFEAWITVLYEAEIRGVLRDDSIKRKWHAQQNLDYTRDTQFEFLLQTKFDWDNNLDQLMGEGIGNIMAERRVNMAEQRRRNKEIEAERLKRDLEKKASFVSQRARKVQGNLDQDEPEDPELAKWFETIDNYRDRDFRHEFRETGLMSESTQAPTEHLVADEGQSTRMQEEVNQPTHQPADNPGREGGDEGQGDFEPQRNADNDEEESPEERLIVRRRRLFSESILRDDIFVGKQINRDESETPVAPTHTDENLGDVNIAEMAEDLPTEGQGGTDRDLNDDAGGDGDDLIEVNLLLEAELGGQTADEEAPAEATQTERAQEQPRDKGKGKVTEPVAQEKEPAEKEARGGFDLSAIDIGEQAGWLQRLTGEVGSSQVPLEQQDFIDPLELREDVQAAIFAEIARPLPEIPEEDPAVQMALFDQIRGQEIGAEARSPRNEEETGLREEVGVEEREERADNEPADTAERHGESGGSVSGSLMQSSAYVATSARSRLGTCRDSRPTELNELEEGEEEDDLERRFQGKQSNYNAYLGFKGKKIILDKGFDAHQLTHPHISNLIRMQGWEQFGIHHDEPANWEMVREFYANLDSGAGTTWVRGKTIRIDAQSLNHFLGTQSEASEVSYELVNKAHVKAADRPLINRIARSMCGRQPEYVAGGSFNDTELRVETRAALDFYIAKLKPITHVHRVSGISLQGLSEILLGKKVNVGEIIFRTLMNRREKGGILGFPNLIRRLCDSEGVNFEAYDQGDNIPMGGPIPLAQCEANTAEFIYELVQPDQGEPAESSAPPPRPPVQRKQKSQQRPAPAKRRRIEEDRTVEQGAEDVNPVEPPPRPEPAPTINTQGTNITDLSQALFQLQERQAEAVQRVLEQQGEQARQNMERQHQLERQKLKEAHELKLQQKALKLRAKELEMRDREEERKQRQLELQVQRELADKRLQAEELRIQAQKEADERRAKEDAEREQRNQQFQMFMTTIMMRAFPGAGMDLAPMMPTFPQQPQPPQQPQQPQQPQPPTDPPSSSSPPADQNPQQQQPPSD